MFRSFIYLDQEKMYSYLRQIDKEFAERPIEISSKKIRGATVGVSKVSFNAGKEVEEKRDINTDCFNDYDRFEKDLETLEREQYFDFVLDPDCDLKTIPRMSIFRVSGQVEIPEEFDIYNMTLTFMPMLKDQIQAESNDESGLLSTFLENASADIPVLIEEENVTISGKLRSDNLRETYSELEEYSEQEVYVLCKVIGLMDKEQVEIFNPLKDFIKLPRAVRRKADDSQNSDFKNIVINGPVLKVEIIAIYK